MKSGGGWYRVSMVNTSPSISLDVTSATIDSTTPLDITYTVTEPEGTPTTVAITDGIPDSAVTITHTTSNNHVRAVFDGSTALTANTITFTATDGVNTGVATCTINASYFNGVFAMWADGTAIKSYAGASVATSGTTSESHSTISRSGLRIETVADYIQYTGLPDFDFDPSSGENFIVWAMRYPTPLSLGYGMSIRDKNGTTINFINGMQRFQSNVIHEMNMFTSNDGGSSFTNGRGNYPYADLSEYGHPGAGSDYMQDKYIVYAIDSSNASVIWCKEVGGNGLAFQLKPNFSGAGRTQFNSNADNMITFFGGAPHVYTIPGVSGGSGNHSVWKVDVAAVAVYPISFGGGNAVTADFASVIGS